ncbi:MAG: hypothetical protein ACK4UQ_00660 [Brevundimonas sp.]
MRPAFGMMIAAALALSSTAALACAAPPRPRTVQEQLADQRAWRGEARAIALGRVVQAEGRDGVYETVVALKGAPPRFSVFADGGGADCRPHNRPVMGNLAILYFFDGTYGPGPQQILPLERVVDPALGSLLRAAAGRASRGEVYLQAPLAPASVARPSLRAE